MQGLGMSGTPRRRSAPCPAPTASSSGTPHQLNLTCCTCEKVCALCAGLAHVRDAASEKCTMPSPNGQRHLRETPSAPIVHSFSEVPRVAAPERSSSAPPSSASTVGLGDHPAHTLSMHASCLVTPTQCIRLGSAEELQMAATLQCARCAMRKNSLPERAVYHSHHHVVHSSSGAGMDIMVHGRVIGPVLLTCREGPL